MSTIETLLLQFLRGRWVEVDRDKLKQLIARELGRGDRALRTDAEIPHRASLGIDRRGSETLAAVDLVITSYGALLRYDWLSNIQ